MTAYTGIAIPAIFFLAACARPLVIDGALTAVPYELEPDGRIVVEVQLNDAGPYRFAIDTAATGSFVFARARNELSLELVPGISANVHGAVAAGTFPIVDIARLEIGRQVWPDARLIALPGDTSATRTLDGVLGADFLRRYAVGVAVREQLLRLYHPETVGGRSYRGWAEIPLEPIVIGRSEEPLRYLEIEVAGRSVPALFDLGAGVSVLNAPAARILRLAATRRDEAGEFSGAIGSEPVLARLGTQSLRTGGVRWRNETFLIADLEIFETLQSPDRPLAILGSGLFRQRDFLIDLARDRLLVRDTMPEHEE